MTQRQEVDERIEERFAELVVERALATAEQVAECDRLRRAFQAEGRAVRLGVVMIQRGYVTKPQALELLKAAHKSLGDNMRLGGYEIVAKLGEGAMGAVYKANQISMDRLVALKVLPRALSGDEAVRDRFLREARIVARLNHPNIVRGYEVGEGNGYQFFAMEFVEGGNCRVRLKNEGPVKEMEAVEIGLQVASALQHAHDNGVVHRDVKPDNIMIGMGGVYKLADLGLAIHSDQADSITQAGNAVGTPYYMAPEQAEGRGDIDGRADLYALGATLYHLVTGALPFEAATVPAIMTKRLYEDPVPACSVRPGVSRGFTAVLMKMMARMREDRYQTGHELVEDLERLREGRPPRCLMLAAHAVEVNQGRHPGGPGERLPGQCGTCGEDGAPVDWAALLRRHGSPRRLAVAAGVLLLLLWLALMLRHGWALRGPHHPRDPQADWSAEAALPAGPGREIRKAWMETRDRLDEQKADPAARARALAEFLRDHPGGVYAEYARQLLQDLAPPPPGDAVAKADGGS